MLCGAVATACLAGIKNRSAGSWILVGLVAVPAITGLCSGPAMFAMALALAPLCVPAVLLCTPRLVPSPGPCAALLPIEPVRPRPRPGETIRRLGSRQDALSHRAAVAIAVMDRALADAYDRWKRDHDIVLELKIPADAPHGRPCPDCRG